MRIESILRGLLTVTLLSGLARAAHPDGDPGALFARKCSSCHTFGKGDSVGPDLKGATQRRSAAWLVSWIRSSESMIRAGDETAVMLFQKYKQQRMPDHDLTTPQIEALLDYLASGGPEAETAARLRPASSASTDDVELGRKLFYGKVRLTSGGASCVSCHSVFKERGVGSLGSDLTRVYSKYQDKGLSYLLQDTCFPRVPAADGGTAVTSTESFALKAFLREADLHDETR
jgi:mono/diheme cytochrome c family protein